MMSRRVAAAWASLPGTAWAYLSRVVDTRWWSSRRDTTTSTVSRICQRIRVDFEAWRNRDLSGVRLDYLFLDGSHFKMHPGAPAEPVLAAWGIDTDGRPVFVGLAPAASESTDAWDDFLADLTHRGLRPPLLGISDGAPGLTGALRPSVPHQPAATLSGAPCRATRSRRCPSTTRTR